VEELLSSGELLQEVENPEVRVTSILLGKHICLGTVAASPSENAGTGSQEIHQIFRHKICDSICLLYPYTLIRQFASQALALEQ